MTTTAVASPTATVEELTGSRKLDAAVKAVIQPDSTLDELAYLLRQLGQVPVEEIADTMPAAAGRLQALCWFAAKQLTDRWDTETRCAPPSGLAEVVRDAAVYCGFDGCLNRVLPWQDEFCSDDCRNASMREHGETRVGA